MWGRGRWSVAEVQRCCSSVSIHLPVWNRPLGCRNSSGRHGSTARRSQCRETVSCAAILWRGVILKERENKGFIKSLDFKCMCVRVRFTGRRGGCSTFRLFFSMKVCVCAWFCMARGPTLGPTVKPVEGGRGEEGETEWEMGWGGMRWVWGSARVDESML